MIPMPCSISLPAATCEIFILSPADDGKGTGMEVPE
jgi:hypothetical protein